MKADDDTDSMPRLELATDVIGSPMPTLLSVTEILSGTSPMPLMVPDNQSMTPMTIGFYRLPFYHRVQILCQSIS
jgi:hypothetical protein